jgi:hypothetical protein|nr:MAG TPA: hypothetical protein [Caudoviricetes sp.]
MGIDDEYTAFCFDEACNYILNRIRDGETPVYEVETNSMSDFYARLGV